MCGAIPSLPNTPSRCGARLKQRDTFTFIIIIIIIIIIIKASLNLIQQNELWTAWTSLKSEVFRNFRKSYSSALKKAITASVNNRHNFSVHLNAPIRRFYNLWIWESIVEWTKKKTLHSSHLIDCFCGIGLTFLSTKIVILSI